MTQSALARRIQEQVGLAIEHLPLRSMHFDAEVRGLHVGVRVTQTFKNTLDNPVEAIYVFPMVPQAAVLGAKLKIGDKTIESELRKREDAQKAYAEARDAGHHAAMVGQERPNIFTMSVAGVEPGEQISVDIHYIAPVDWQDGGGRLQIPLVVAPHFVPGHATGKTGGGFSMDTDEVPDASRITPKSVPEVSYSASLKLSLTPGFEAKLGSPSHSALVVCDVEQICEGDTRIIELNDLRCDRDIVITYKTQDEQPTIAVERQSFITTNGETDELTLLQISAGCIENESEHPLDVALLLDTSGSMRGQKINGLKKVAKKLLTRLSTFSRPVRVTIHRFANYCEELSKLAEVDDSHFDVIDQLDARGGTNAGRAITAVMDVFRRENKYHEKCIVLVCDGQTDDRHFKGLEGVRIHSVGIDNAIDNATLKEFSDITGGSCEWILPGEDYDAAAARVAGMASGPVLRDLQIRGLPDKAKVVNLGDCYHAQPRTIGILTAEPIEGCVVVGCGPDDTLYERAVRVPKETTTTLVGPLFGKMLLNELQDQSVKTETSLRYGVLCSSTALIAVSKKDVPGAKPETIDIPVLMPHGWEYDDRSEFAVRRMSVGVGGPARRRRIRRLSAQGITRRAIAGDVLSKVSYRTENAGPPRHATMQGAKEVDTIDYSDMLGGGLLEDSAGISADADSKKEKGTAGYFIEQALILLNALENRPTSKPLHALHQELKMLIADSTKFAQWSGEEKSQLLLLIAQIGHANPAYAIKPNEVLLQEPAGQFARLHWMQAKKILGLA